LESDAPLQVDTYEPTLLVADATVEQVRVFPRAEEESPFSNPLKLAAMAGAEPP
jgi:hypothetical protein